MNSKIRSEYQKALQEGYVYVASVVKSYFDTTYYHVVPIEDILAADCWLSEIKGDYPNWNNTGTWHGRCGSSSLPDRTIARAEIYRRARSNNQ